eukprot:m.836715 g.836715  ORF g.836715 m.836715 type:complete len:224 (+) comp59487_c0_seq14:3159-3830(+)
MQPDGRLLGLWCSAQAVCFDVDSTVCEDEGIDNLAAACGVHAQVAELTTKAMSGSVPFEAALTARLALMRPSAAQVQACAQMPPRLTSGIASLVTALHARGVRVFLISGGFFELIRPVADLLHIPAENIFANRLLHDEHGEFLGHDTTQPTSRSGGKVLAVREIRQRHQLERICMIGDGTTDLETMGDVELFIGFGGNVVREKVQAAAPWFTHSFAELEALLG